MAPLNILIAATLGSAGDVMPYLHVGAELRRRGNEVTFLANAHFAARAAAVDLTFVPVGTIAEYQEVMADRDLFSWTTYSLDRLVRHWVPTIEPTCETIRERRLPGRTVLLAQEWTWSGGWIAAEKYDIPLAVGVVSPARLVSKRDPPHPQRPLPWPLVHLGKSPAGLRALYGLHGGIRRVLAAVRKPSAGQNPFLDECNRVRALQHLPPLQNTAALWATAPQRVIGFWPAWFSPDPGDWPKQMVLTDFPLESAAEKPKESPSAKDDAKPLVFTAGSVACDQKEFFGAITEACGMLGRRGILVTPHAADVPDPLPKFMTHLAYAPFDRLFGEVDLALHHGGVGTVALALAAGIPQIVRPLMGEQFDLGYRMERLGVGKMLRSSRPTSREIAAIIEEVRSSQQVMMECARWRDAMKPSGGVQAAAQLVEALGRG